tara:strand:+ start:151 stop:252 length:102 start_codon:yes stop_codon:yes gene_type:complete
MQWADRLRSLRDFGMAAVKISNAAEIEVAAQQA